MTSHAYEVRGVVHKQTSLLACTHCDKSARSAWKYSFVKYLLSNHGMMNSPKLVEVSHAIS